MAAEYTDKDILNVAQAAEYLHVSQATVRQHCAIAHGEPDRLPNFRMGNAIRIPFWGLLGWVASRSGAGLPRASKPSRPPRMIRKNRTPRRVHRTR